MYPNRVRIVEKTRDAGTVINTKGYTSNWRQLRTSLGMSLSDSFYFADKTLLVEGPEDVVYTLSLLRFLAIQKNKKIDINMFSIITAGGADNLPAMTRIIKDEDRPIVILMDNDKPKIYKRLCKMIKKENVKKIDDFEDGLITIQDLLPKELYENAVNKYIDSLIRDGVLKEQKVPVKFKVVTVNNRDKSVDVFTKEQFGEDVEPISKLGIAREFENELEKIAKYDKNYKTALKLTEWVIEVLNLELK